VASAASLPDLGTLALVLGDIGFDRDIALQRSVYTKQGLGRLKSIQ